MNYGGAYRNDPARLAFQARAEDLHVVENLIVNKEGRIPDVGYFSGRPDPVSTATHARSCTTRSTTPASGATSGLLGLGRNVHPARATPATPIPPPPASLPPMPPSFDLAHAQGAVTGYVHPFDSYPDPADTTKPLTHELPVDVALGKVDYYEAIGFVDDYDGHGEGVVSAAQLRLPPSRRRRAPTRWPTSPRCAGRWA